MMADKASKNGTTHPGAAANIVPKEECVWYDMCFEEDHLEKCKKEPTCSKPPENPLTPAKKTGYPCRYCGLTFSTLCERNMHWPIHITSCVFCGVKFTKDNTLYEHTRRVHIREVMHHLPRPTEREEKANIIKNEKDKLLDEDRKSLIPSVSKEQDVFGKSSSSPENPPSTSNRASNPNKVSVNMKANSTIHTTIKLEVAEAGNHVSCSLNKQSAFPVKSDIISERPPATTPEFTHISNPNTSSVKKEPEFTHISNPNTSSVKKESNSTKTKRSKSLIEGRKYVTRSVSKEVTSLGQSSVIPENLPSTSSKINDAATPNGLFMNKKADLPMSKFKKYFVPGTSKENVVVGGQSSTPPENEPSTSEFFHASNPNKDLVGNASVCNVIKTLQGQLKRKLEQAFSSDWNEAGYNEVKSITKVLLAILPRVREDPAPPIESNDPASGVNYPDYSIRPKLNFDNHLHIEWLIDFITSLKSTSYPLRDTTSETVAHLHGCVIRELTVPGRLTGLKPYYMSLIEAEEQLSRFLNNHFLSVSNLMM